MAPAAARAARTARTARADQSTPRSGLRVARRSARARTRPLVRFELWACDGCRRIQVRPGVYNKSVGLLCARCDRAACAADGV